MKINIRYIYIYFAATWWHVNKDLADSAVRIIPLYIAILGSAREGRDERANKCVIYYRISG